MKEICIPFSNINEAESAELEIKLSESARKMRYRLESVNMTKSDNSKTNIGENYLNKLWRKS